MRITLLKLPLTPRNRLWFAAAVALWVTLVYGLVGQWSLHLSPRTLPLSRIDRWVPFWPDSFWVYASIYLVYALSCILQRELKTFRVFLYAYSLAYVGSALFFLAYPTTFPRQLFPVTVSDTASLGAQGLSWFRTFDHPTNCLPSMHVASVTMAALPFYGQKRKTFVAFAVWGTAIAVSTLTTKQHYVIDVVAGSLYGWVCYRGAHWLFSHDPSLHTSLNSEPRSPRAS